MYTLLYAHLGHISVLQKEVGIDAGLRHDSIAEASKITPEAHTKIQEFAQKVMDAFEKNPDSQKEFISSLDGIKESIFRDPVMFRAFINRAYEKQSLSIAELKGGARLTKIREFSTFITDVMFQFAGMNDIPRFLMAIEAQKKALDKNLGAVHDQTNYNSRNLGVYLSAHNPIKIPYPKQ